MNSSAFTAGAASVGQEETVQLEEALTDQEVSSMDTGGHRTQDTGHWTLDTGYGTQDTGYGTQDTGHRTQDTGHRTQDTGYRMKY